MRSSNLLRELKAREHEGGRRSRDEADRYLERHWRVTAVTRTVVRVLRAQSAERVSLAASGAAFWLVIAAFPTAIAAVSVYGLFVSPARVATDLSGLANGVPGSLGSLLTEQLRHVAGADHTKVSVGLAVSLALALWSASAGINKLNGAIRDAYGLPPQRYFEARGRALVGALVAVVLLGLVAIAAPVVVRRPPGVMAAVGALGALAAMTVAVGGLYRFSVGAHVAPRSLFPGALTSACGVVVVVAGFDTYVGLSPHFTAVYGALAGAVIAMLALYLAVYVVLLGAVLNMELAGGGSNAVGTTGGAFETAPNTGGGGGGGSDDPSVGGGEVDEERARSLITAERARVEVLLAESARSSGADRSAENEPGDMGDAAEPLTAEGVDDAVAAALRLRLDALDRAERRLEAGTFGLSVRSGRRIPDERLEADPAAELTVDEANQP